MSKGQGVSSSGKMGRSIAWDDVAELGNQLASQMSEDERPNLLGLWMAHRIAELIAQGKHAKRKRDREDARTACSNLVLKAWRLFRIERLLLDIKLALRWSDQGEAEEYEPAPEPPDRSEEVLARLRQLARLDEDICLAGILADRSDELAPQDEVDEEEGWGFASLRDISLLRTGVCRRLSKAFGSIETVDLDTAEAAESTVTRLLFLLDEERRHLLAGLANSRRAADSS